MATLNHIGIAVADLPRIKRLFQILDLEVEHEEDVPTEKVRTHFIPFASDPQAEMGRFELLESTEPDGAIAKFVAKRGPGIHHISFLVDPGTLAAVSEKLAAEGFKLIYDQPRPGAHQMRVNFIHPSTTGGILVEIMEPRASPGGGEPANSGEPAKNPGGHHS